jgi:hypothetical protein
LPPPVSHRDPPQEIGPFIISDPELKSLSRSPSLSAESSQSRGERNKGGEGNEEAKKKKKENENRECLLSVLVR